MELTYQADAYWGTGHYVVYAGAHADKCQGRVSVDGAGLWSAYPEPLYPSADRPLKAAVIEGRKTREEAGRALFEHNQNTPRDPLPVRRGSAIVGHVGDGRFT